MTKGRTIKSLLVGFSLALVGVIIGKLLGWSDLKTFIFNLITCNFAGTALGIHWAKEDNKNDTRRNDVSV